MKKFIGYYTNDGKPRVLVDLPPEDQTELDESLPESYACCSSDRELGGAQHERNAQ